MVRRELWIAVIVSVFFTTSTFGLLQQMDSYNTGTRHSSISPHILNIFLKSINTGKDRFNQAFELRPTIISTKNSLSRPVRRIGSEFLGKRGNLIVSVKVKKENDSENYFTENEIINGKQNENNSNSLRVKKRSVQPYHNKKNIFRILLSNNYGGDLFGKRVSYVYPTFRFHDESVGSEFLGKRSYTGSEFLGKRGIIGHELNNNETRVRINDSKIPRNTNYSSKENGHDGIVVMHATHQLQLPGNGKLLLGIPSTNNIGEPNFFVNKRGMGSEFLGKRGMGSEFLGKRGMGSEFLGKRRVGSEFLGKRKMGPNFMNNRAMDSQITGNKGLRSALFSKRRYGSKFFHNKGLGSEFLGKLSLESLHGKRRVGSEFLGKRALQTGLLEKRGMGSEFLGKRTFEK